MIAYVNSIYIKSVPMQLRQSIIRPLFRGACGSKFISFYGSLDYNMCNYKR